MTNVYENAEWLNKYTKKDYKLPKERKKTMTASTHLLGGAATSAVIISTATEKIDTIEKGILVTGIMLGAILCDIDNARSKISYQRKMLRGVVATFQFIVRTIAAIFPRKQEKYIRQIVGHRGISHSLCMVFIIGIGSTLISRSVHILQIFFLGIGISIGMASHILLDMLANGVPLFAPITMKRITLAKIKTGGVIEWIFRMVAGSIFILIFFKEV